MTDINIPPEAVKAVAYKLDPIAWRSYSGQPRDFKAAMDHRRTRALEQARAAILAMIEAWPGMLLPYRGTEFAERIILPLPETKKETQPGAFDYWPAEEEGSWGDD